MEALKFPIKPVEEYLPEIRLSLEGIQVLYNAVAHAEQFGKSEKDGEKPIGPNELALAVIGGNPLHYDRISLDAEEVYYRILQRAGYTFEEKEILTPPSTSSEILLSLLDDDAKIVMRYARDEANAEGKKEIELLHILSGIWREKDSVAAEEMARDYLLNDLEEEELIIFKR